MSTVQRDEAPAVIARLRGLLGEGRVRNDDTALSIAAHDIFFDGPRPSCVIRPSDKRQVAQVMAMAAEHDWAVHPRGGGMSYTRGYLGATPASLLLDLGDLNRVVAVQADDLYVTVEAGVTWKQLYDHLLPLGMRVPVFGTMSGSAATVGGGLSQGSIFYGSGLYGTSADMVLGLEVVLPNGELVRTGQGGVRGAAPFFRYYGPDLSGPFLGDCGAFGVKVEATLKLMSTPQHVGSLSFAFDRFEPLHRTQLAINRAGLAAESFAFDAILQHQLMERTSLLQDVQSLGKLIGGGGRMLRNLKDAVSIATAGKRFLGDVPYSLHLVIEARHEAAMTAALDEATAIARDAGGRPIPDTIPRMMRVSPFGPMDATLGPAGERWVPTHGCVPISQGAVAMQRVQELFGRHRERLLEHGILIGLLTATVAPAVFVIEALFYWRDHPSPLHQAITSAEKYAQGARHAPNPAARALVQEMRSELVAAFREFGSAHLGSGRTVPYATHRDEASARLLRTVKHALDPRRISNPGVLGLE
jgi:FAD/FMN-containing dehydrogenase